MRKIFTILFGCAYACTLHAQEPADALRYSWYTPGGTARQQAIGGAMGSLGGDLSAAFVNPAGLSFYKTGGDVLLTPGYQFGNNKSTFYGRTEKDKKNNFSFGASGVVWGRTNSVDKKGRANVITFAVGINRAASFGNNLLYRGL